MAANAVKSDKTPGDGDAVVLLSGGLDSATALAIAASSGHTCHALTIDYGQTHRAELEAAADVARHANVASHQVVRMDLRGLVASALMGDDPVPRGRSLSEMDSSIPPTYVPARNLLFLSLALANAETLGAQSIYIGVSSVDYSGYPDCRPEFISAFREVAAVATRASVGGRYTDIVAPLLYLSKAATIQLGTRLGVNYSLTLTCYEPSGRMACGACDACTLRRHGFASSGVEDPTEYVGKH